MDIKKTVEELVKKLEGDGDLAAKFKADPVKTIEGMLGIDLPDEAVKAVAHSVKEHLEGASGGLEGIFGKIKHLF